MSRRLRAQLDRLEGQLREVQAPVVRHLRPPATATQVQHAFRAAGVREHEDVVTWWSWHDGTDLPAATSPPGFLLPEPGNRLIGALHLPTLDQAMLGRRRAIEIDTEVWGAPLTYRPEWFPVLQFVDGWLVCVDTVGEKGPLGSLFVHDPHAEQDHHRDDRDEQEEPGRAAAAAGAADRLAAAHRREGQQHSREPDHGSGDGRRDPAGQAGAAAGRDPCRLRSVGRRGGSRERLDRASPSRFSRRRGGRDHGGGLDHWGVLVSAGRAVRRGD